ncbi:MAG: T9SS type A sorting domain-containing protein [Flavobacteriales bacterium]|nr:T9SS type A sorting domain-containing protein [Flavobacteriales bacterium]
MASGTEAVAGGPPTNDLCSAVAPEALAVGSTLTFTGDNTNATYAGDAEPGTLLDQYPSPNTWHAFTTTACADVTVSYCGTASGWSNVWKLLTTDCPAQTLVNPTTSETTTCGNGNWTFSFSSLPAGTYYLPVPNVGFGQGGGPYSVDVSAATCANAAPENDLCSAVTPEALAVGQTLTFTGDNTNATYAGDAEPGTLLDQYPSPNTWHAFTTSTCADVTVSYCSTASGWSNVWKLLTTDCPAQTLVNPSTSETTTCGNGNWTFSFSSLPAGTYYLPVPNVGFGQGGGPYSVDVSAATCANAAPENDLCSAITPEALAVGQTLTFTGDNTNATYTGDAEPGTLLDQYPSPNTWHAFTTTACADVTVSYCATDSGWSNVWKLLTTDCPAQTLVNPSTMDTTTCSNGNWTFSFGNLPAGTYYLPVPNVGFGQGGGAYSVNVDAVACLPTGEQESTSRISWTVFPNPSSGRVQLSFGNMSGPGTLELLDMAGRVIRSEALQMINGGHVQLDLGRELPVGQYILRLSSASGRQARYVSFH